MLSGSALDPNSSDGDSDASQQGQLRAAVEELSFDNILAASDEERPATSGV
jgi:hypothetical protein